MPREKTASTLLSILTAMLLGVCAYLASTVMSIKEKETRLETQFEERGKTLEATERKLETVTERQQSVLREMEHQKDADEFRKKEIAAQGLEIQRLAQHLNALQKARP